MPSAERGRLQLVFLHGLESGPYGSKWRSLQELGTVISPDCQGLSSLDERMGVIEAALAGHDDLLLVGSSFGGLAALQYIQNAEQASKVKGLVLCAPALHCPEMLNIVAPPTCPTWLLHGLDDDVVPADVVVAYALRYRVPTVLVRDGHRLQQSTDVMMRLVKNILKVTM